MGDLRTPLRNGVRLPLRGAPTPHFWRLQAFFYNFVSLTTRLTAIININEILKKMSKQINDSVYTFYVDCEGFGDRLKSLPEILRIGDASKPVHTTNAYLQLGYGVDCYADLYGPKKGLTYIRQVAQTSTSLTPMSVSSEAILKQLAPGDNDIKWKVEKDGKKIVLFWHIHVAKITTTKTLVGNIKETIDCLNFEKEVIENIKIRPVKSFFIDRLVLYAKEDKDRLQAFLSIWDKKDLKELTPDELANYNMFIHNRPTPPKLAQPTTTQEVKKPVIYETL